MLTSIYFCCQVHVWPSCSGRVQLLVFRSLAEITITAKVARLSLRGEQTLTSVTVIMKENMPVFTGVGEKEDVVDISEYSHTTRTCHKKLQVLLLRPPSTALADRMTIALCGSWSETRVCVLRQRFGSSP